MKNDLEKRLVYLFSGEFAAVITFIFVYFFYRSAISIDTFTLNYVFVTLNFILLQGSLFWFIKWRRLKTKRLIFPKLYRTFIIFKKINFILLCATPIILLIEMYIMSSSFLSAIFLIMIIYGFAIIEYINYYHIQLTNYNNGRGKKASIAKEIRKYSKRQLDF
ncbi:hypothetical protein GGQ92_001510 [Gracilibacillus halotolerans]|uniref:General stress protein n=1 Tax=Gracilibacillus halotolerans TaxID=74386 RepID=A0A841RP59_9BACI|nr:hypothetical protein [Gracilibacillus halotolerans]MBB6512724.1 hypothetical protein [Gracilibacillus halotolerans]